MHSLISKITKTAVDSANYPSLPELMSIVQDNNAAGTIPAARYNQTVFSNWLNASIQVHQIGQTGAGAVGKSEFVDGETKYTVVSFTDSAFTDDFIGSVESTVDVQNFLSARAVFCSLIGVTLEAKRAEHAQPIASAADAAASFAAGATFSLS